MRVSLIIPTYERGEVLATTMAMALGQNYDDFEVIVVDQSPETNPAVAALVKGSDGGRLKYIRLSNPNLPGARNEGVRAATGEVIVFIDDDVVIEKDFVSSYVRVFADPAVGGAMGMTLLPGVQEPNLEEINKRFWILERFADGTAAVSWLIGCNSAYRRKAIIEAGMSDERFTGSAWSEDADLSVRVRHLGYRFIYDPRVRLLHLALPSGGCANRKTADPEERDRHRYLLFLYFVFKNRAIMGARQTLRNVWRTYRDYAFNRSLLLSHRWLPRHALFAKNVLTAFRMAAHAGDLPKLP